MKVRKTQKSKENLIVRDNLSLITLDKSKNNCQLEISYFKYR